ncbi:hypothetical protein SBF1_2050005 [Candidatus Desulfosporosinus infrequens]|uniref:Uncharacterized protein n=1 Tax=Candidatus Desulfosporosinus infrequens TaxID=2043169 RepID=A0A2U3KHX7_9FIRM|nr:hypothetical protein SBF1_2050005 [Candidatus Desulfosporosinus infrequens]
MSTEGSVINDNFLNEEFPNGQIPAVESLSVISTSSLTKFVLGTIDCIPTINF